MKKKPKTKKLGQGTLVKKKAYVAVVLPCPRADLYAVCLIDQRKPSIVQSLISAHLLWADAEECKKFVQRQIRIWALEGVEINSKIVHIVAPNVRAVRWSAAMRAAVKAAEFKSEIAPFTSISELKGEAQRSLKRLRPKQSSNGE
jgi:hypothetical protein